jgi:hypothetical protein
VNDIAIGIPIYCISAIMDIGMEFFKEYLSHGKTVVFFGSSGVEKSTYPMEDDRRYLELEIGKFDIVEVSENVKKLIEKC